MKTGVPQKDQSYLIGQRFGSLVVEDVFRKHTRSGANRIFCKCRCDCGNEKTTEKNNLISGGSKTCGCRQKYDDLTGRKFGLLTVIEKVSNHKGKATWKCLCDCGNTTIVIAESLKSGNTKSCGCLTRTQNGDSTSRLYVVWVRMKDRCYHTYCERYKNYGGRGIKVCDEWLDFKNFKEWAMSSGYNPDAKHYECTLDRIDVNGDYCPQNCRWISMKEQFSNKTDNRYLVIDDERMTMTQAAQKYNISKGTLWYRLEKAHLTDEEAVKRPVKTPPKKGSRECLKTELVAT